VFDLYTLYHLILVSAHNGDEPPKIKRHVVTKTDFRISILLQTQFVLWNCKVDYDKAR